MKIYAENRKARFNYEIIDEYEAGIVLRGHEVKSVRLGQISLKEAFATIRGGDIWLTNAHINLYKQATVADYDPTVSRKLLLSKAEIAKLSSKAGGEGFTIIPLKIYDKNGKIKVALGLGRGKKKYDKRETIKKRDLERDARRELASKSH